MARRQLEGAVLHPYVHGAEERQEPPIGAKTVVHGLGVQARVFHQAVVEALYAQVLGVERVLHREQALIFGVEQENQA